MITESSIETWVEIESHPGYLVSSLGRVTSKALQSRNGPSTVYALVPKGRGYLSVTLRGKGGVSQKYIHHLVAESFICPRPEGMVINHKDGVKSNNSVENLEYVSPSENNYHAYKIGLKRSALAKFSEDTIRAMRQMRGLASHREIAIKFGVTKSKVNKILNNHIYTHVTA